MSTYTRLAETLAEFDALHPALAPDNDPRTDKVIDAARAFVAEAMLAAPQAEPRVERYGDGVLVHWPDGTTSQYLEAGDCVTAAPQPQAAPSIEAAHEIGKHGGPVVEAERLAFEAWMRGHCWALCATWDGKQYRSDAEQGGGVDPQAVMTRRLFAAWRDRAALAAPQPQEAPRG